MLRTSLSLALILAAGLGSSRAQEAPPEARRPNVLLLMVDDLRPELRSFGAEYIDSPHIDELARTGRAFTRHFVQAPTCGASRYAFLTGRYPDAGESRGNDALVRRAARLPDAPPSLPDLFRAAGYATVAVGKVSHHPGGLFGERWNDPEKVEMPGAWTRTSAPAGPWGDPQGLMHGLANGLVRERGVTPGIQAYDGPDDAYPDGLTVERSLQELRTLAAEDEPFLLAVGLLRPHLPFGAPACYLLPYLGVELPAIPHPSRPEGRTTWHGSGEFLQYNHDGRDPREDGEYADLVRRHYAACVSYADAQVGRVLTQLDDLGLTEDTIVVLWGDHGWHLGEHGVWGKHTLFEESLRAPLILRTPGMQRAGELSHSVVESVDVLPTLCELAGLEAPVGLDGRSLVAHLADPDAASRPAIAYKGGAETIRDERWRLIRHRKAGETVHVELYDHASPEAETRNAAERAPDVARALQEELDRRLQP